MWLTHSQTPLKRSTTPFDRYLDPYRITSRNPYRPCYDVPRTLPYEKPASDRSRAVLARAVLPAPVSTVAAAMPTTSAAMDPTTVAKVVAVIATLPQPVARTVSAAP